jgi:hypothetical protein
VEHVSDLLTASGKQGSQIHRILMKFDEMRRNRSGPNSKIGEFYNLNLIFLNKNIKIHKKLDEIVRPLVKFFFSNRRHLFG